LLPGIVATYWRAERIQHPLLEPPQSSAFLENDGDVADTELIEAFVVEWIGIRGMVITPTGEIFGQPARRARISRLPIGQVH
jgi:hypothetical protein